MILSASTRNSPHWPRVLAALDAEYRTVTDLAVRAPCSRQWASLILVAMSDGRNGGKLADVLYRGRPGRGRTMQRQPLYKRAGMKETQCNTESTTRAGIAG